MARTADEIQADIDETAAALDALLAKPAYSAIHGQVVDDRENIKALKRRLRELNQELAGRSVMQGPDLDV